MMQLVTFNFQQSTPSTTWNINHNLNCKPVVDTFIMVDGVSTKVFPQKVLIVDDDTVVVSFSAPTTGAARLVGQTDDILRSPSNSYFEADGIA